MNNRRSSTVQQNQLETSTSSSVPRAGEWMPSSSTVLGHERDEMSAKHFIQSCTYRQEHIDRQAIVKRQDMEACLQRLSSRDDVEAVTVATMDGRILYKCDALNKWIPTLTPLCSCARDLVRDIDPEDNIQVLRLRTKNYEMIITIHDEQLLIAMQTLRSKDNLDTTANSAIEEDWEAFLQRLQQHTKKDAF